MSINLYNSTFILVVLIYHLFNDRVFAFAPGIQTWFPSLKAKRGVSNYDNDNFFGLERGNAVMIVHRPTRIGSSSVSEDKYDWMPEISDDKLHELDQNGFVVIPNFISEEFSNSICKDIRQLRSSPKNYFKVARIGQSSTNKLNTDIRVAETCFIDNTRTDRDSILPPSEARQHLYQSLENLRQDLAAFHPLDSTLTELLYAYYPSGGFYRRHRDAIPGSASNLRTYSLLLYLNQNWQPSDGGCLRMHMDEGGDYLPEGAEPDFIDVEPRAGTLVLFKSDKVPHEVLDTSEERMAVVGWYNRYVTSADAKELLVSEGSALIRPVALLLSTGLVAYGVSMILG